MNIVFYKGLVKRYNVETNALGRMKLPKRTDVHNMGVKKRNGQLFLAMLKTGLFTFGGGYAMLPLLEREFVERRGWISGEEFLDMVAIAESTPGPIAINAATYIGYKVGRIRSAALATLAVCLPSLVILYLISLFLDAFLSLRLVAAAFRGVQVCVVYLILSAGLRMLRKMEKTPLSVLLCAATLGCSVLFSLLAVRFSSVLYILLGGAAALCVSAIRDVSGRRGKGGGA